jgi:hypothetical protein
VTGQHFDPDSFGIEMARAFLADETVYRFRFTPFHL